MRTTTQAVAVMLILGSGFCWAQGPNGRQNGNRANLTGANLDLSRIQTITGAVTAVNITPGAQYPFIEVGQAHIKVAPAWFLLEQDFEIRDGDLVRVAAAPSATAGDGYLYALDILKTATGEAITLRQSSGAPLWAGGAGRQGRQSGSNGGRAACLDPASVATVSGVVDKVTAGVGIAMPALILRLPDGALITVKIGPERILLDNDFELLPGETVSVKLGRLTCVDEYVALTITNSAGVTVVLREDDGAPAWN